MFVRESLSRPYSSVLISRPGNQAEEDDAIHLTKVFDNAAEIFAVLSSPVRLRIILELNRKPLKVTELAQRIKSSQPNISIHLRLLRQVGVVKKCCQLRYSIQNHFIAKICENMCDK